MYLQYNIQFKQIKKIAIIYEKKEMLQLTFLWRWWFCSTPEVNDSLY